MKDMKDMKDMKNMGRIWREYGEYGEKMERDSKGNQKLFYRVLKTARMGKQDNLRQIKNKRGIIQRGEKEIMERWREYFQELLNVENTVQIVEDTEMTISEHEQIQEDEIDVEEVQEAVKTLKRGKAAGYDRITPEMMQSLGDRGMKVLTELFNRIWKKEKIPEDWEVGVVIPLFKKGDGSDCNNYRGITLLSVVLKVYERILEKRLRRIIESQLDESQSGFRKGRSTHDHIFTLKQLIEKRHRQNKALYLGFIDIQKAFDSVQRGRVWQSLQQRGVPAKLRGNIQCIYRRTRNYVRRDNAQSEEFVTEGGLRQGGVLSPALFIIIMDDILKEVKSKIRQIHVGYRNMKAVSISECLFADDLVILAGSEIELQKNMETWRESLAERNMKINIEKTKVMVVGKENKDVKVEMDGMTLQQVKDFKYLGIHIQENGRQEAEVNERVTTAVKTYHALGNKFLRKREISRGTKMSVYRTIYCPILTYGCESWVMTNTMKSKIQAAEMKYLRRVKGITRRDRIRNELVRDELKVEPILKTVERRQLGWFGHLARMEDSRQVKAVWLARVPGRQRRGRPRKTWDGTMAEILKGRNLTWREAQAITGNKREWAHLVHK